MRSLLAGCSMSLQKINNGYSPIHSLISFKGYRIIMNKFAIIKEFWDFLRVRKKWWLMPIVFFLLLAGLVVALSHGSAVAPFIYTIF